VKEEVSSYTAENADGTPKNETLLITMQAEKQAMKTEKVLSATTLESKSEIRNPSMPKTVTSNRKFPLITPMKTKAVLILSLLSLTGVAGVFAAPPEPIDPARYGGPIRVACVGDSITEGGLTDPGKSYPDQLQGILGGKWLVKNFGVGGRTLLKEGDQPYWKEGAFKAAHDFLPDAVIIMLGTNDTKPQNWVHSGEFYNNYKDLIKSFKNLSSKPRVFICRPNPVFGRDPSGINEPNVEVEIPIIDKLAADENVSVIDMHAALAGKPEMSKDGVHPTNEGAGLMAKAAATALTGNAKNTP